VLEDLRNLISPPWEDSWEAERHVNLRDFLDGFTLGNYWTISEEPYSKPGHVMLARVDPVEEQVWDFRCLHPPDGMRALGCLRGTDQFLVLEWYYRENLETSRDWLDAVARCKTTWRELFDDLPPHSGGSIHDYVSDNFRIVRIPRQRKNPRRHG
jgi:hypothetical protein